jgi:hypothetical protein
MATDATQNYEGRVSPRSLCLVTDEDQPSGVGVGRACFCTNAAVIGA